ncbi:hypothetical protein G9A89_009033 [Geosiphon pyriformis]|nr:hypothetical protein G9A89_009033 [Geosiphon pyriformis]
MLNSNQNKTQSNSTGKVYVSSTPPYDTELETTPSKSYIKNSNLFSKNFENTSFPFLLAFRIFNSLVVRSYFVPDEYWQTVEVAHRILHAPRLLQAVIAAIGDLYTFKFANYIFKDRQVAKFALFSSIISWFNFYCGIRMLSNNVEAVLTIMALYYWPLYESSNIRGKEDLKRLRVSFSLAAFSCILRPTNLIVWIFLGMNLLINTENHVSVFRNAILIMILAIVIMITLDYAFYKTLVFIPLNFLRVNVFQSISIFYGAHPWHWYLTQGIPVVTTTLLPFMIKGMISSLTAYGSRTKILVALMLWVIFGYSLISHKEFRFIYPFLPIANIFAGFALKEISQNSTKKYYRASIVFLIVTNVPLAYYASCIHQRGVIDVMDYLRLEIDKGKVDDIGFLMPCHSTPFYSNLHRNISMWFLTCEPPLSEIDQQGYMDEADQFYSDPLKFLSHHFEDITKSSKRNNSERGSLPVLRKWPSHLVIFEALLKDITSLIEKSDYQECSRFFNSHFHDDSRRQGDVILFCREKLA